MVSYGFFDSVNGDRRYSAEDFTNFLGNLVSDGVIASPSNCLQVQASEGFTIKITAGWAYILHHYFHNDSDFYLTLDAPDIARDRVDRIVIRFDVAERKVEFAIRKGEPKDVGKASVPAIQRDETIWELSLARIYVAEDYTEIRQEYITDERDDSIVCGWVTGLIQQIDTTNLFAQYDDAFWAWFNGLKKSQEAYYVCNGVDDNIKLPLFVNEYHKTHNYNNIIKVVGKFGIDDTTTDTGSYMSIVSLCLEPNLPATLDFADCEIIDFGRNPFHTFAFFKNCTVKNLRVWISGSIVYDAEHYTSVIHAENCYFDNCVIVGNVYGDEAFQSLRGFYLEGNGGYHITNCKISMSARDMVGIYDLQHDFFTNCSVGLLGGKKSVAFRGNGFLTNCTLEGDGTLYGCGVEVFEEIFLSNCTVEGYCYNTQSEAKGYGLYSSGAVKVYLNGVKNVVSPPFSDSHTVTTNSLKLASGSTGFYTGTFEAPVDVPSTVVKGG